MSDGERRRRERAREREREPSWREKRGREERGEGEREEQTAERSEVTTDEQMRGMIHDGRGRKPKIGRPRLERAPGHAAAGK